MGGRGFHCHDGLILAALCFLPIHDLVWDVVDEITPAPSERDVAARYFFQCEAAFELITDAGCNFCIVIFIGQSDLSVLTGHEAHDARREMRPEVDIECGLHALRQVGRICLHSFGPGGAEIVEEVAFDGDAFVIDLDRQAREVGMLREPS